MSKQLITMMLAALLVVSVPQVAFALIPGDFELDGDVDIVDFAVLAAAWRTASGQPGYNGLCDISEPPDEFIDANDLSVFVGHWLEAGILGMVSIEGGEYEMGEHFDTIPPDDNRVHTVRVDSFRIGQYEITNGQYCEYLNSAKALGLIKIVGATACGADDLICSHPYYPTFNSLASSVIEYVSASDSFIMLTKGDRDMTNDPVFNISWYGAAAYCNWRSLQEGYQECYNLSTWQCDFSKHGYRLPTEAEWEYAARGGLRYNRFPWGDTITHVEANYYADPYWWDFDDSTTIEYHWACNDNIFPYTAPVDSFAPNGYGLYEMAGNVGEWCNDWYDSDYYNVSPYLNPTGPASGTSKVMRGGTWSNAAHMARVSDRRIRSPGNWLTYYGFRVVLKD